MHALPEYGGWEVLQHEDIHRQRRSFCLILSLYIHGSVCYIVLVFKSRHLSMSYLQKSLPTSQYAQPQPLAGSARHSTSGS